MYSVVPQEDKKILIVNTETGEEWLWPDHNPPDHVWKAVSQEVYDNVAVASGNMGAATPRSESQAMSAWGRQAKRNMGAFGKGVWDMNFGMSSPSGWGTTGWDPNPNAYSWGVFNPAGQPLTNAAWAMQQSRWRPGQPHPQFGDGTGNVWNTQGIQTQHAPVAPEAPVNSNLSPIQQYLSNRLRDRGMRNPFE